MLKKYLLPMLVISVLLSGCYRTTAVILPPETTTAPSGTEESTVDSTNLTQTSVATNTAATAPENTPESISETQADEQKTSSPQETRPQSTDKPASSNTKPIQTATQPQTEPSAAQTEPTAIQTEPEETSPDETQAPTQPQHPVYDISGHSVGALEKAVLEAINAYRTEAGLSSLSLDKKLSALATIRAYECSESWSSTRPDGRGWKTVLSDYGYSRRGSNAEGRLYCTQSFGAELIVDTWMNSSQKDNILSESFTHAGVGVYKANGKIYVVVIYAG